MVNSQVASILLNGYQVVKILIASNWSQLNLAEQQLKAQIAQQWTMAMHFERYDQLGYLKNRLWQALINQELDLEILNFEQWKLMMLGAIDLVYPVLIIDESQFQEWTILTIDSIDQIFSAIEFVCYSDHFVVVYDNYYHQQLQEHFSFLKQFFAIHFSSKTKQADLFKEQQRLLAHLKQQLIATKNEVQLLLERAAKWDQNPSEH